MTGLYLSLLIVGLTTFIIAIFGNVDHDFSHDFGHDFHGDHGDTDHPGLFSLRTISALFAGFGVAGLCATLLLDWGIGGQLFLGFATGFGLAALTYGIMRFFYSQQAGAVTDSSELVGRSAIVTTGVGDQGIGECKVENKHYTFREKNGLKLQPNEVAKVVESEVGLLIVEKV